MKIVICGGGIIGSSTAYYLTKLGQTDVTILERTAIAGQASGKAGGFLARDWCDGGPVGPLANKSFDLHAGLSEELGVDVGYRKLDTLSLEATGVSREGAAVKDVPGWVDGNVTRAKTIGTKKNTAQVHPRLLTHAFVEAAKKKGAKVTIGEAVQVKLEGNVVKGVVVREGEVIAADVVVVAMGPWSGVAREWFPGSCLPKITGSRAHSIVLDPKGKEITPHALFLDFDGNDPEVYPRPDGTVYVCGNGDKEPLPDDPSLVAPDEGACKSLLQMAGSLSAALKDATLVASQACYLPGSSNGIPLVGKVPKYEGAYIATGHTCWGILNAPATGLAMAEIVVGGKSGSVNVEELDPKRFVK